MAKPKDGIGHEMAKARRHHISPYFHHVSMLADILSRLVIRTEDCRILGNVKSWKKGDKSGPTAIC